MLGSAHGHRADLMLNALGWARIGPWKPDIFGRRHAPVTRQASGPDTRETGLKDN